MRLLFLTFVCAIGLHAAVPADSLIDFSATSYGNIPTASELTASSRGHAGWQPFQADEFLVFTVASNRSYSFPAPRLVNGTNYTETGTHWLKSEYGDTGDVSERLQFDLPGSQGAWTNCLVEFFFTSAITNTGAVNDNLDIAQVDGNPYGIVQLQVWPNYSYFIAHADMGNGVQIYARTNVVATYFIRLFYASQEGVTSVEVYDPAGWQMRGVRSEAQMEVAQFLNYVTFHSTYLQAGNLQGYSMRGGITVTYNVGSEMPALEISTTRTTTANRANVGTIRTP